MKSLKCKSSSARYNYTNDNTNHIKKNKPSSNITSSNKTSDRVLSELKNKKLMLSVQQLKKPVINQVVSILKDRVNNSNKDSDRKQKYGSILKDISQTQNYYHEDTYKKQINNYDSQQNTNRLSKKYCYSDKNLKRFNYLSSQRTNLLREQQYKQGNRSRNYSYTHKNDNKNINNYIEIDAPLKHKYSVPIMTKQNPQSLRKKIKNHQERSRNYQSSALQRSLENKYTSKYTKIQTKDHIKQHQQPKISPFQLKISDSSLKNKYNLLATNNNNKKFNSTLQSNVLKININKQCGHGHKHCDCLDTDRIDRINYKLDNYIRSYMK